MGVFGLGSLTKDVSFVLYIYIIIKKNHFGFFWGGFLFVERGGRGRKEGRKEGTLT